MTIDVHSHAVVPELIEKFKRDPDRYGMDILDDGRGGEILSCRQGYRFPLAKSFYDLPTRLANMDRRGIDLEFVSCTPPIFAYWEDPQTALEMAQISNDAIANWARKAPGRVMLMGSVPMQDIPLAIGELERIVEEHGAKAIQIGSSIEGKYFDEPEFLPFFKRCEELNVAILFHPYYVGDKTGFSRYYQTNTVANPLDTTLCITSLVFGGVVKACPNLKLFFVHGGGYIPYQRGRLEHCHKVRNESRVVIGDDDLGPYFDSLYFDTITFWDQSLEFLINTHERTVLGSDYPFDMADFDPANRVKNLAGISAQRKQEVLGKTVKELFQL